MESLHAVPVIQTSMWLAPPPLAHSGSATECSTFNFIFIDNLFNGVFKSICAKHNFYYIRYISVYIQPRYFYLIFRNVNGNNMNRVILQSVRPSFRKKRGFSHAFRRVSTESGFEISDPWWWILADLEMITSVWSRERDTGDKSEPSLSLTSISYHVFIEEYTCITITKSSSSVYMWVLKLPKLRGVQSTNKIRDIFNEHFLYYN